MEHQPITYGQLLAQTYEENAKDLLVYQQNDYEDVRGNDIQEHNATQNVGQELIDPHEFQRFGGARGTEDVLMKPKEFEDKGSASVRRAKDVQNHIFNIDTLFRPYAVGGILPTTPSLIGNKTIYNKLPAVGDASSSPSHFVFNLDSQYKNIISAKLSSLQLPNKFFNLVDLRNNFYIYTKKGNYGSNFAIPITSIGPAPRNASTIIQLGVNISPLVVGDQIKISGTVNYNTDGDSYYIVQDSTISTITIAYVGQPAETVSGTLYVPINPTNTLAGYTRVSVYITSANQDPRSTISAVTTETAEGQTGFYYSNTSIFPELNSAYSALFADLQFSYMDGFCNIINNSLTDTYTINLTPETAGIYPAYFQTLGAMLGFYRYIYQINPANSNLNTPCNFGCAQLSSCSTYGSLISENKVDMNADPYIQIAIQNWENIYQQDGADAYYGVFQKIPVNVAKGDNIYDIVYNNSVTKKYNFMQPTNLRYLEIYLYDRLGHPLLMPGVEWSMTIELEEVLNSALYDKLREL